MGDLKTKKKTKHEITTDVGFNIFRITHPEAVSFIDGNFSECYKEEVKALLLNNYQNIPNSWLINQLLAKDPDIPLGVLLTCYFRYCLFINADTSPMKPIPAIMTPVLYPVFSVENSETADHLMYLLGSPLKKIYNMPDRLKEIMVREFKL
jgi:hypothetical protein